MLLSCRLSSQFLVVKFCQRNTFLFIYLFIYLRTVSASETIMSNVREVIERNVVETVEEAAGVYCEVLYQNLLGGTEEDHEIC
jgi:hypothetical protein